MISILSVNFNSNDWCDLLLESIRKFSSPDVETVIVDNSYSPVPREDCIYIQNKSTDKTHGQGLQIGIKNCTSQYLLILDVDCHILAPNWEQAFLGSYRGHHCLTVKGSQEKPIRPACLFMRTEDAKKYDWRATPGYRGHRITPDGYDVAIGAYHRMMEEVRSINYLEITKSKRYTSRENTGEEYGIDGTPYVYHHWHGTHLKARASDYPHLELQSLKGEVFANIPWRKTPKFL